MNWRRNWSVREIRGKSWLKIRHEETQKSASAHQTKENVFDKIMPFQTPKCYYYIGRQKRQKDGRGQGEDRAGTLRKKSPIKDKMWVIYKKGLTEVSGNLSHSRLWKAAKPKWPLDINNYCRIQCARLSEGF